MKMNILKGVIVDDEKGARETLKGLLDICCPQVKISAEAASVREALEVLAGEKPDILFLDIEMPGGNGFDLLQKLKDPDFHIIFTTAYDQHALKAFRFSALDYLLKPINMVELKIAVGKAEKSIRNSISTEQMSFLLNSYGKQEPIKKIALPLLEGSVFIEISDIIRCEAEGSYTKFYFSNRKPMLVSKNLKEYEDLLQQHHFIRVHHSSLVSCNHISQLNRSKGIIYMADGTEVEISQRKKAEVIAKIDELFPKS